MPFAWPNCQHRLHLGCLAHLAANVHPLRCPSCREQWPPQAAEQFLQACRVHGVAMPSPALEHDTTSASHRQTVAPHPPPHVLPLCCPRIYLADSARAASPEAWQELPDRHKHWAPVHRRGDNVWMPEWTCLRCNTTVDGSHHLLQDIPDRPVCPAHGPRLLALDLRENSRGWVCARGSPPQILPCMPARILDPQPVDAPPDQASSDRPWYTRGPPSAGSPASPTHSWIFVPLLHAAVGRLHPQCEQQWASHASLGDIWTRSLQALRLAGIHALHVLQQLASGEGRPVPVQEAQLLLSLAAATNALPTNTHSCTCHGHGDSSFCQTGTYRPPPRKHCSTCTPATRRQPTCHTPHSRRVLPRAPSPTLLPPAVHAPAVQPPACQNSPLQRARSPMQTLCHQNPLTPLPPVLWTPCRDHACKQPWLVLTRSLPRMFCCSLVTCSAARQLFAKHNSVGPSLSLSN